MKLPEELVIYDKGLNKKGKYIRKRIENYTSSKIRDDIIWDKKGRSIRIRIETSYIRTKPFRKTR